MELPTSKLKASIVTRTSDVSNNRLSISVQTENITEPGNYESILLLESQLEEWNWYWKWRRLWLNLHIRKPRKFPFRFVIAVSKTHRISLHNNNRIIFFIQIWFANHQHFKLNKISLASGDQSFHSKYWPYTLQKNWCPFHWSWLRKKRVNDNDIMK